MHGMGLVWLVSVCSGLQGHSVLLAVHPPQLWVLSANALFLAVYFGCVVTRHRAALALTTTYFMSWVLTETRHHRLTGASYPVVNRHEWMLVVLVA